MDISLSRRAHHTGLVGALTALSLFASYGWFGQSQSAAFGPPVTNYARLLPLHSEHQQVARDFFDVIAILVFTYLVMGCVERLRDKPYWFSSVLVAGLSVAATWLAAVGALPWDNASLSQLGGEVFTQYELVLFSGMIAVSMVPLTYLVRKRRHWLSLANLGKGLWRGFNRWLAGYLTLWGVALVFLTHPYFREGFYANARLAFNWLLLAQLAFGLPYALLTNWLRYDKGEHRKDPCFGLLLVYRRAFRAVKRGQWAPLLSVLRVPWVRSNLLDLFCVKFFFLPIMLCFVFSEGGAFLGTIRQVRTVVLAGGEGWSASSYGVVLRMVMLTDVVIGVIGYAGTSRWLSNKSKSVDPTMTGWIWALLCYPPFNHASSVLFPFHSALGAPLFSALWLKGLCNAVMLICFAIYAWATVAFGLRFSNMTHRGIICHGPYAFVRHPAYISKGVAWLAELLPKLADPWQVVGLFLFTGIYAMRGITEERHLNGDPDYREYCKTVRYRFIPGVV